MSNRLKKYSIWFSTLVITTGILVLSGWQFDIIVFLHPLQGTAPMNPMTAVAFIFSGSALLLLIQKQDNKQLLRMVKILAALVSLIGVLRLLAIFNFFDAGIDRLLFAGKMAINLFDNRPISMAPYTAINFLLSGISLLLLSNKKIIVSQWLSLLTAFAALLSIIGYTYGVKSFYDVISYFPTAIHTIGCFLLFSTAILFYSSDKGFMTEITSPYGGGKAARLLLMISVLTPIMMGLFRLYSEKAGLESTPLGNTVLGTSIIIICLFLVWKIVVSINKSQKALLQEIAERKILEDKIRQFSRELETRVDEKTKEVIEKEQQYRFLLENMGEGIQIIGYDWRYLFVNNSVALQVKSSREELLGFTIMEKYPSIENSEMFHVLRRCMKDRSPQVLENEFTFPDGTKRWFGLSIQPVPEGVFILSTDITERKYVEDKLRLAQFAIDNSGDTILWITPDARIVNANDAAFHLLGYTRKELLQFSIPDIDPNYDTEVWPIHFAELRQKGSLIFETLQQAKDGRLIPVEITANYIKFDDKELNCAFVRNITDRKITEQNLELQYKELAFQNDEKEKRAAELIIANKELAFQNDEKEKRAAELIIANKELAFQNDEKEKRAAELIIANKELAFQNNEKEKRAAELIIANKELAFQNDEKEKRAAELVFANKELALSNLELEQFTFIASHDLQEPLRMVSSFMNLLEKRMNGQLDETTRQYIHFAVDGAERMKTLIQAMLQYSRIGANKENFAAIDLNEVMQYTTHVLKEDIQNSGAVVTVNPMPLIPANKSLISQLFVNLVSNALKYNDEKVPVIEVGYSEEPGKYIFYVKDNGIGIDSKFFNKIFIIFQRLHNKIEYSGTGIGLAICKKIIEIHNGKIWLKSKAGNGSTFYFSIPKQNE